MSVFLNLGFGQHAFLAIFSYNPLCSGRYFTYATVYLTHTNRVETAQTFHGSFDRMTALTDAATFKCIKCNYYILCTPNFCA